MNLSDKTALPTTAPIAATRPEFFRLPARGPDPYFGLTRSYYYQLEAEGRLRLVRIRQRGRVRGIVLIPFDSVSAFIRSQVDEGQAA